MVVEILLDEKNDDDDDETYKGPSMSLKDTAKEVGKMF